MHAAQRIIEESIAVKQALLKQTAEIEKAAEINDDEGWIEFAKRLSRFLKPSQIRFHKSERSS